MSEHATGTGDIEDETYPFEDEDGDEDDPSVPIPRAQQMRQKILANSSRVAVKTPRSVARGGKRILSQEKRRKALELRKGGASYIDIANAVGYKDQSGARKAVLKAMGDVIQEPVLEVRSLQIERLNHMLLALWPKVQLGDERAIQTSLSVMDKIDRLMGTEAAQQVDVNVHQQGAILVIDGSKEDFIKSARQMAMGIQGDGTNNPLAIESGQEDSMDLHHQVIDAEVVEDRDEPDPVPVRSEQTEKPKKTYKFGVDPKR